MDEVVYRFLQQLLNGISMGGVYALVAVGYGLVYGYLNMMNFAHGDVYMLGGYLSYTFLSLRLGVFESVIISMIFCAIVGMGIERFAYRPLRNVSRVMTLLTAIAAAQIIRSLVMIVWSSEPIFFPEILDNKIRYFTPELSYFPLQIIIIFLIIILWLSSLWLFKYTKIGKAIRAISQDSKTAWLMGIQVNRAIAFVYAYGAALAALAGFLVARYYLILFPTLGFLGVIRAWTAAVIGGIGNLTGAVVGGLLIGIIESFTIGYISSAYKDAIVFVILVIVLIFKPTGLFKGRGQKV